MVLGFIGQEGLDAGSLLSLLGIGDDSGALGGLKILAGKLFR